MSMTAIIKRLLPLLAFLITAPLVTRAQTINAASCNTSDVQTAINTATEGQTVTIPSGTCTWTSGVTVSGKGINIQGAGSGRIVGYFVTSSALTLGTQTLSETISPTNVAGTLPSFTAGQTLRVIELGFLANYLQGTVTSYNSSTGALVMNITSYGGTCGTTTASLMNSNCKRWMISTSPSVNETALINNLSSGAMFTITEDTSFDTSISEIHFMSGTTGGDQIYLTRNGSSGQAILIHDNMFENGSPEIIDGNTNRGVVWNNSFIESPFSLNSGIRVSDSNGTAMPFSWTTTSTMGTADTTGQNNFYVETNDFEADGQISDWDSNARAVVRYNFLNNSSGSTHGADTSWVGQRHFEFYNNVGIFNTYTDGSTANMNWWMFVRGGTFVFTNNTLPAITSQDWGAKPDINLTVMNLNRNSGENPCWGYNTTGGADYHAPRQVGMGYVTGNGTANYPPDNCTNCTNDQGGYYVGDSEPAYGWGNSRSPLTVNLTDYPNGAQSSCTGGTPDVTSNYIVLNRDYFNGTTPKPGWSPYTYPHPLTQGTGTTGSVAAPTGLAATVAVQ